MDATFLLASEGRGSDARVSASGRGESCERSVVSELTERARPTLAGLLSHASSALAHAADTARPHLDSALAAAHSLRTAVHRSDNPAARALVDLAANPRLHALYDSTADLVLRNLPLVVSLVGLALHLFISDLARKRSERSHQRLANQRRLQTSMGDYGLGTPSQAGAGTGQSRRSRDDHGVVEVQWGRETLRVPLPPPNSPLSTLRATLYNLTGVPPSHQKLIYAGAVLKDDLAPLSAYGLTDEEETAGNDGEGEGKKSFWDSWALMGRGGVKRKAKKLVMLGSKDVSARVDDRLSQRKDLDDLASQPSTSDGNAGDEKKVDSEEAVQRRIREISTHKLDELEPQVKQVESWLAQEQARRFASPSSSAEDPDGPAPPRRTLLYLSEVLLQGLLKLDSIEIPSGYAEARRERKEAVRRVQEVLDRVDSAKEGWKKLGLSLA